MIKICFTLLHVWRISPLTTLRFWRRMVSRVKYSTMTQKDGWKTKIWRLNWSLSFKLLTLRYWKNLKHFSERSSKLLCTWRSWKFSSMVCSDSVSHQISTLVLSGQKKTKMQKSWRTCWQVSQKNIWKICMVRRPTPRMKISILMLSVLWLPQCFWTNDKRNIWLIIIRSYYYKHQYGHIKIIIHK